jgi:hypothetical protein
MPNGHIVIAKDNVIKFFNPQKEEFEKALTGHVKTVYCLLPLPDGNLLSAGKMLKNFIFIYIYIYIIFL